MEKFSRIILIEPNLISYGHVVELPLRLQQCFVKKSIDNIIVGNKAIKTRVSKLFPNLVKKVTNTCFQRLEDKGNQFYTDLLEIDRLLKLNKNDLVLILTSYTNEVYGTRQFVEERKTNCPVFCLWCHQLFPPEKNFLSTLERKYRESVRKKLKDSFDLEGLKSKVFLFTTPSSKLKRMYQDWTGEKFGTLPIPYVLPQNISSFRNKNKKQKLVLGFLGDGRYEKGLLLALETVLSRNDSNRYIIQILNPRGFPKEDFARLDKLLRRLRMRKNIKLYEKPLLPGEFSDLIDNIDVVLLPYHPGSYDARVSAVLIESIIKGKVVVVTKGTWLEEQVNSMKLGETFKYTGNQKTDIINFNSAIDKTLNGWQKYDTAAVSLKYREYHNPDSFLKTLLEQIK